MDKPRDICKVIDAILPILRDRAMDVKHLEWLRKDAAYAAPEVMGGRWLELCKWLSDGRLPDPTAPRAPKWVKRISDIIEGRVTVE